MESKEKIKWKIDMASRLSEEAVTRSPRSPFSPLAPFLPGLPLATELELLVESKEKVMIGKGKGKSKG